MTFMLFFKETAGRQTEGGEKGMTEQTILKTNNKALLYNILSYVLSV